MEQGLKEMESARTMVTSQLVEAPGEENTFSSVSIKIIAKPGSSYSSLALLVPFRSGLIVMKLEFLGKILFYLLLFFLIPSTS